jgi:hypothetical protein
VVISASDKYKLYTMQETLQILDNIRNIYASTYSMERLKEFERVMDELDVYVFDNWFDGEVVEGPKDSRYFTEVTLMYQKDQMPDPEGGKRLLDYGCSVSFQKDVLLEPRQIKTYDDLRPGTQKGKIDQRPIWLVRIKMPKSLMKDMSDAIKIEPSTGIDDFNPNLGESFQKPYVSKSSDGWEVKDKDNKTVFTDKDERVAFAYFKKNYDKLKEQLHEEKTPQEKLRIMSKIEKIKKQSKDLMGPGDADLIDKNKKLLAKLVKQLHEDLRQGDMEGLISPVFGIDTYKSKMGEDSDIVTLNFRVNTSEAAQDLSKFFERGYKFVLDADASPADDSKDHMVFVELERGRDTVQHIKELLYGLNQLTRTEAFRFRYKDDFRSNPMSEDNIRKMVPLAKEQYIQQRGTDNATI